MTETTLSDPSPSAALPIRRDPGKRRDELGRAFAGSQMCLQVWVNRRHEELSRSVLQALGIEEPGVGLEWVSPLERERFAEYKDGAFLRALGLAEHAQALAAFWPKGGPVWDGLGRIIQPDGVAKGYVLVEAKSYPAEVKGSGCKATKGSDARTLIEASLAATARWLGLSTTPTIWMGNLYQSANRIAHVYLLREKLGLPAYMVNVCFIGDTRRPTTEEVWNEEKNRFRRSLEVDSVPVPWLVDVFLPAPSRAELVSEDDSGLS